MPEKKFDLNKTLNTAGLYTKINYGDVYIPDIQRITNNFETWRKSQGYKTEEEKQEDLKAETQAVQQRFNEQDLWNSEDPYEVYNAYEIDPAKQAEFQRNGQMVAGIGSTIATLPFTAGMMGWIPGTASTITGVTGSYAGAYGGQKLGQYLDNKYGWNTTPYLSFFGGLGAGILGGGLGYRSMVQLGSRGWLPKNNTVGNLYNNQFGKDVGTVALSRQLKKAPSKTNMDYYRDYNFLFSELTDPDQFVHVSPNPISGKNVSVGAAHSNGVNWVPGNAHVSKVGDDNMVWLWTGKPYRNRYSDQTFISIPKIEGMVQTRQPGAVGVPQIDLTSNTTKIITKNPITGGFERQLVVSPAQSSKGAYTWFERPSTSFKGTTYAGKPGTYAGKEVPTWQLPRGERNQPVKPKYENLKFIRHLSGLPNMEDGMVIASPKLQGISNWTTDLPFRRHKRYQKLPGTEYMIVDPEAFVGLKPLSIEPMDTMFLNSELRIHPKHITILSGNTDLLRKAEQLGMRTATTPELQTTYNNIIRKILEVQRKYEFLPKSKGLNLTKPLSGLDALSDDAEGAAIHLAYRKAADDYFNSLPRPKYQAYHDMQKATGLNANVKLAKQLLKEFDDAVLKANSVTPLTGTDDIIFRYPGTKKGRTVWNMKNERRPDFYKHVGYAPSTSVENDLLLKLGLHGTEAQHPAQATLEKIRPALEEYLKNIGALKHGGKINN